MAENIDALGLSAQDKQNITSSWALTTQDHGDLGVHLFKLFFSFYPAHARYFNFNCKVEELSNHPRLRKHASGVVRDIASLVANIDSPTTVIEALKQNAVNHRKRNIKPEVYDDLRVTMAKLLAVEVGDKFTSDVAASWDKALKTMFNVITESNAGQGE